MLGTCSVFVGDLLPESAKYWQVLSLVLMVLVVVVVDRGDDCGAGITGSSSRRGCLR